jgi:hypothetical protein
MSTQVTLTAPEVKTRQVKKSKTAIEMRSRPNGNKLELVIKSNETEQSEDIVTKELKLLRRSKLFVALKVTLPSTYTMQKADKVRRLSIGNDVCVTDFLPTYGKCGDFVFWVQKVPPKS